MQGGIGFCLAGALLPLQPLPLGKVSLRVW